MADRRQSRNSQKCIAMLSPSHGKQSQHKSSSTLPPQTKETVKKKRNARKDETDLVAPGVLTPAHISFEDGVASGTRCKASNLVPESSEDARVRLFETPEPKLGSAKRPKKALDAEGDAGSTRKRRASGHEASSVPTTEIAQSQGTNAKQDRDASDGQTEIEERLTPTESSSADTELFSQLLEVFAHDADDDAEHPELLGFSLAIVQADVTPELDDEVYMDAYARLAAAFAYVLEEDETNFVQDQARITILSHQICVCLALLRCLKKSAAPKTKKTKTSVIPSDDLLKDALELLGKMLTSISSCAETEKKRKSRKDPAPPTVLTSSLCECLECVAGTVRRMAESDEHLVTATRIAINGLMSEGHPPVQEQCVKILKLISARSEEHRRSVIEEVFLAIDVERLQHDKVSRSIKIDGKVVGIRPVSAVLFHVFQSPNKTEDPDASPEMLVRRNVCYLIRMFEGRFLREDQKTSTTERSGLQQKDWDGKAWLETLLEDIFAVLHAPQFPVADLVLTTLLDKFQSLLKVDSGEKLLDRSRAIVTDLLGSMLARLVAVRRDAKLSRPGEELSESSARRGEDKAMPPSQREAHDWNFEDPDSLRDLVLRGLRGDAFQDARELLQALWACAESEQGPKKGKGKSRKTLPSPSPELLQEAIATLALNAPLLQRLGTRVNNFVLQLVKEGKSGDRLRILRAASDIFDADIGIVHPSFLKVVRQQYLFDPTNAGVRASAVELLGKVIISNMTGAAGMDVDEDFETLASRALDTSVKVRSAVLAFFTRVCDLERSSIDITALEPRDIVGMCVATCTPKGAIIGKVVGFNAKKNLFDVDYSNGDIEHLAPDCVWERLLVGTHLSDLEKCSAFRVRPRLAAATAKAAAMLLYGIRGHEEECTTTTDRCIALFTNLWFKRECTVPCNVRLQEIEEAVQSTDSQWLEAVLKHCAAGKAGVEVSSRLVDLLWSKIAAIHNAGGRSPSQRPSAFNDFQTRATLLLPVIQAMVPFAKAFPHLFASRLLEFGPMLGERELCKEQGLVLRHLLDVLDAVMASEAGKLPRGFEDVLLNAFRAGALKLNDPKRFAKTDEISRAVRCMCTMVKSARSATSERAVLALLSQCVSFLTGYIDNPAEERVPWLPRSLVLAGAIIRFCAPESLSAQGESELRTSSEQLYLMSLSHFSNHIVQQVKKASLFVVGSVLVHEPEKALHKSCMKLLVRSLSTASPPSLQCQVLRNLYDQFQVEDDRMAASAHLDSSACSQDDRDVGTTSTSVMHKFHDLILSLSLSENVNVRFDAVNLVLLILRRGMTATYLAIPFLVAQQALSDGASTLAMRALDTIREKETTHYQAHAFWEGIVKSTQICTSEADLSRTSFAAAFRHLASIGKDGNRAVRQLLQCAASKFDKFSAVPAGGISVQTSFDFKLYAASVVAHLPFNSLDGPLFFIHQVHKIVTMLAGGCLEGLGSVLAEAGGCAGEEAVERWRQEGACIALLLSVQDFLQGEYSIKGDRIKRFLAHPDAPDKTPRLRAEDAAVFRPACLFQGPWRAGGDQSALREDLGRLRALLHGDLFADSLGDALLADPASSSPAGAVGAAAPGKGKRARNARRAQSSVDLEASTAQPEAETEEIPARKAHKSRGSKSGKRRKEDDDHDHDEAAEAPKHKGECEPSKKKRKVRRL